ncbi:MAG: hypothetical protein JNJ62_07525 [Pseudoxanthomonas mexicana]|nr:hypothetical protein [Pseudoxanthomonas mexicana]
MTVKIKEASQPARYQPRFDFERRPASDEDQTATIKDLLHELNLQKGNESIADYNLKSLGTTLRFVSSISDIAIPKRIDQHFPVASIKTIKLLFKCSQFIDAHLIRVIGIPGNNTPATVDFFTSPATPASEDVKRQISRMICILEKEIEKDDIAAIEEVCDPARLREQYRQDTNEAVDKILLTHIHLDDDLMEKADVHLADRTQEFLRSITPLRREPRLHVATYTYLKLLDYIHRLHFEIETQLTIPNDRGVANIRVDFGQICSKLSIIHMRTVTKDTNIMAVDEVALFIEGHRSDIAQLVSNSTGFKYNKRDVLSDSMRATIVLQLYLASTSLPSEANPKPIGVLHVVAAFCSVLHQRKVKSKPERNSKKYGAKFSAPQKLLDQYISLESTHIPWTVQFTYLKRIEWYVQALLGRKEKADSHLAVQIAQSELSKAVFMTLSHTQVLVHMSAYRAFVTKSAHDFVALHNKQDTIYEWRHGG